MGNTKYRMGDLLGAIELYQKTLEINPDDEDAKYNIEFIRKKIKENMEKQKAEQQKKQEAQAQEGQAQKQEAGEEKGEGDKEGAEERKKEGTEEKKAEGRGMEEKEMKAEGDMSKEDAYRILDALKDDEKDLQKELRTQPGEGRHRVDKDW